MAYAPPSPLVVARRVIYALMMRELKTRFGAMRAGALWVIADPLIQVGIFVAMFGFILHRVMPNVDYTVYLVTGIVPWTMFSTIITRGMASLDGNKGLFTFRQVRPIDTLAARVILEVLIHAILMVVMLGILALAGKPVSIDHPLEAAFVYCLLAALATGLALFLMAIANRFPEVKKVVGVVLRLMYFVSGILMPMQAIPAQYRDYFYWNPVLHAMDLSRLSFFPAFHVGAASWSFLLGATLMVWLVAVMTYEVRKERLLA